MSNIFAGRKLILGDGSRVDAGSHLKGKVVLLFFTCSRSLPAQALLPSLENFYDEAREEGKHVEIIAVSEDGSEAIAWQCVQRFARFDADKTFHKQLFLESHVHTVPVLIPIGPDGAALARDVRDDIIKGTKPAADLCEEWTTLMLD